MFMKEGEMIRRGKSGSGERWKELEKVRSQNANSEVRKETTVCGET
jgi:hypothetical protein